MSFFARFNPLTNANELLNLSNLCSFFTLKSALSTKVAEENFVVLDALTLAAPKTKDFTQVLKDLSIEKKALFVTADLDENVALSARNIPGVTVITAAGINVLDLLGNDKVVFTKSAVEKIEEVLG